MRHRYYMWMIFFTIMLAPLAILYQVLQELQDSIEVRKPDILLITIDTCRKDSIGGYGHYLTYTPVLDGLIRRGIQFPRGYSPAPTTAPSHTTIMTGLNLNNHGVFRNGMRYSKSNPTAAKIFNDFGYQTAAFVSAYSLVNRACNLGIGFDFYDDAWSEKMVERDGLATVQAYINWLNSASNAPVFSWVHLFDPHSPYAPPRPYPAMILDKEDIAYLESTKPTFTESQKERFDHIVDLAEKKKDFGVITKDPLTLKTNETELRIKRGLYDAEICYTDRCLGRILKELSASGRLDRTAVFVTSDHGEGFEKDYFYGHGDRLWESAIAVPWILKLPLDRFGSMLPNMIFHHADFLPTVLDIAGIPNVLSKGAGENLYKRITTGLPQSKMRWFAAAPPLPRKKFSKGLILAAYTERYKMISYENSEVKYLFDLQKDPGELNPISDTGSFIFQEMTKNIKRFSSNSHFPHEAIAPESLHGDVNEKLRQLGYID